MTTVNHGWPDGKQETGKYILKFCSRKASCTFGSGFIPKMDLKIPIISYETPYSSLFKILYKLSYLNTLFSLEFNI